MTDNFKHFYKILKALEAAMDYPEFDISQIRLDVSEERRKCYFEMLEEEGYIKNSKITLQGLEYLSYNPQMIRQSNIAKGIKEIV